VVLPGVAIDAGSDCVADCGDNTAVVEDLNAPLVMVGSGNNVVNIRIDVTVLVEDIPGIPQYGSPKQKLLPSDGYLSEKTVVLELSRIMY